MTIRHGLIGLSLRDDVRSLSGSVVQPAGSRPARTMSHSRPTGRLPQVGERTPTRATQTETSPPLHSASPSSTLHHTFTTDLTLVSCGCSKCSIYRSEAGCLEGVWHALYAKSKLVPLMPAGDISVGYYLYKSMKLFKGLITHYSLLWCSGRERMSGLVVSSAVS